MSAVESVSVTRAVLKFEVKADGRFNPLLLPARSRLEVAVDDHTADRTLCLTLYSGWFLVSLTATWLPMNPAPPVKRMLFGLKDPMLSSMAATGVSEIVIVSLGGSKRGVARYYSRENDEISAAGRAQH